MAKPSKSTQRKFSSSASANYPCQTCGKTKPSATIYLTFDDGIEAGTEEVYNILKSENVPGTFFCVGENVLNRDKTGLFKKIYDDPSMLIGNHSMTHGHQFYDAFYGENSKYWRSNDTTNAKYRKENPKGYYRGLRINKKTGEPDAKSENKHVARRSFLMDFEYTNAAFTAKLLGTSYKNPDNYAPNYLGKLELSKLNYSRFLIARMPGTNHWIVDGINSHPVSTRDEEAKMLSLNNYKIYGWDAEWKLKFQLKNHLRADYRKGGNGFLDFYDDKYIDLDRPTQTSKQIFGVIKSSLNAYVFGKPKKKGKLILLMHERMFRKYKKGETKKYSNLLKEFIRLCKKEKYAFDTLENF